MPRCLVARIGTQWLGACARAAITRLIRACVANGRLAVAAQDLLQDLSTREREPAHWGPPGRADRHALATVIKGAVLCQAYSFQATLVPQVDRRFLRQFERADDACQLR